jgi:hypothetical protein
VGHVAGTGERSGAYRVLVGKPEGKKSLGRSRHRWEDNIEMDFKEIEWEGVDWINLAKDRDKWQALVKMVIKIWVP